MRKQIHVYYSGSVQGVGFRFTVREIADKLSVQGWVKNLDDGRVEILAQADDNILNKFLDEIELSFSYYIHDKSVDWQKPNTDFNDFRITF